jgi:hypothetical protein
MCGRFRIWVVHNLRDAVEAARIILTYAKNKDLQQREKMQISCLQYCSKHL